MTPKYYHCLASISVLLCLNRNLCYAQNNTNIIHAEAKMTVVFFRTVIFYVFLTLMMRLMGKRQMGEMQLPEFAAAVMLSELAVLPITDRDIPLLHGIVALMTLGTLEVITAFLCRSLPRLRRALYGEPIILVKDGKIIDKNMQKARVSIDELLGAIRGNGCKKLSDVYCVILEQSGKFSVFLRESASPVTPDGQKNGFEENGVDIPVVTDGEEIPEFMESAGITEKDIDNSLEQNKIKKRDCLVLSFDGKGNVFVIKKEKN